MMRIDKEVYIMEYNCTALILLKISFNDYTKFKTFSNCASRILISVIV